MSFIARWLGWGPKYPARVPTDEVLPMHISDDTFYLRGYTLMWTFQFQDILDADMLGRTLSELLESDGWRKLGGRLRLKPDGKMEVHVPCPFTAGRPSLYFTKEHHNMALHEHPEAKKLPIASDVPAIFPGPRHHSSLAVGPGAPTKIEDYLQSDVPQFALHVVTFQDCTLVSINFNHVTCDASGLRSVLDAWQMHLAGKPEAKAEFMSIQDGMAGMWEKPSPETPIINSIRLSGLSSLRWFLTYLYDTYRLRYESRTVCIPKVTMDTLLQDARASLAKDVSKGQEPPFITEGDVLVALGVRLAAHTLPESSSRTINQMIAVDPRSRVKSVFREDGAYVQNAPSGVIITCPAPEARDQSLGHLALRMRTAISAQATEAQIMAGAACFIECLKSTGRPPLFGSSDGLLSTSSNWSKMKLLDIDFSQAVVRSAAKSHGDLSTARVGKPFFYHSRNLIPGVFSTSVFIIMGRDPAGNMWITGDYPDATWAFLMEFLEAETSKMK